MEEEKMKASRNWVKILGIVLMICSVIAVFALSVYCLQKGAKDYLYYDREKGTLLAPQPFANICIGLFWTGFAGGMLVIAYEILQNAETPTKVIKTSIAAAALFLVMWLNAFAASSMFVDLGMGVKPRYETYGEGDEKIVAVCMEKWRTVQTYYVYEDQAYWVDGYDISWPARSYKISMLPEGLLTDRLIWVWEGEDDDNPRNVYVSILSFPGYY